MMALLRRVDSRISWIIQVMETHGQLLLNMHHLRASGRALKVF
jgi:hypothetical protein